MAKYKKRVGISLRVENIEKYKEKRDAISQDWVKFFNKLEFMPILIPNGLKNTKEFLKNMSLDMMIFSGGDNIGDEPTRDKTEKNMMEFAIENNIPSLGVCRGMQFFNKFFGGKIEHSSKRTHVKTRHKIDFTDKKIQKLIKKKTGTVNSFHENLLQINNLGSDLNSFSIAEHDKTVEGFYHKNYPIMGVMWHPERELNFKNEYRLVEILENKEIWK